MLSFLFLLLLLSLGCFQILHLFVMSDITPAKSSLVLVLYTGGTVGMKKLSENGMIPINL